MDINYTIKFHTYWHFGSGLAAGGDADLLVVKDKDGVPFVPGKTIKGLVREAVDLLFLDKISKDVYKSVFGVTAKNKEDKEENESYRSDAFFKDAALPDAERKYIISKGLSEFLYQTISNTAITDEGIADDATLRKIQVCVPCELEGKIILDFPENIEEKDQIIMKNCILYSMKYIKRLGSWRNRGLGRCTFFSPLMIELEASKDKKGGEA